MSVRVTIEFKQYGAGDIVKSVLAVFCTITGCASEEVLEQPLLKLSFTLNELL